jgi:hypothetical protein
MSFVVRSNCIDKEFNQAEVWDKRCKKSLKKISKAVILTLTG